MFDFKIKFTKTNKLENGFPVFVGTRGFFLFVVSLDGALTWVIGTHIGDATKIILKTLEIPVFGSIPISGWLYFDGGEWKIDVNLISVVIPTGGNKGYLYRIFRNIYEDQFFKDLMLNSPPPDQRLSYYHCHFLLN